MYKSNSQTKNCTSSRVKTTTAHSTVLLIRSPFSSVNKLGRSARFRDRARRLRISRPEGGFWEAGSASGKWDFVPPTQPWNLKRRMSKTVQTNRDPQKDQKHWRFVLTVCLQQQPCKLFGSLRSRLPKLPERVHKDARRTRRGKRGRWPPSCKPGFIKAHHWSETRLIKPWFTSLPTRHALAHSSLYKKWSSQNYICIYKSNSQTKKTAHHHAWKQRQLTAPSY